MNWDRIRSNCRQVRDRIKVAWRKLKEHDFAATAEKRGLVPLPIPVADKR